MAGGKAGHPLTPRLAHERAALDQCLLRDRRRLEAWTNRLARRGGRVDARELERLTGQLNASVARAEARRASVPTIRYDDTLPVHARRDAIAAAIAAYQVVIVSRQLPERQLIAVS